jgi:NAD(P)-dependent dehydrogenase (short-subunit alcohol dehydrogenase family)
MNKVAIVTGASYGLGEAICRKLLANQYKVYGVSRTIPSFDVPLFVWIKADLINSLDIVSIPAQIEEKSIDLLVNNAGTAFEKPALDFIDEDFDQMFGLNFKAPIKLTCALFFKLSGGLIVNISSISDRYPDPLYGLYGSSKAALNIYFETIAAEHKNVKVINVLPNYIDTPLQHKVNDANKKFDWNMPMHVDQAAELVPYIMTNEKKIESGSRIIVVSNAMGDMSKNPEKLWVYTVDKNTLEKVN